MKVYKKKNGKIMTDKDLIIKDTKIIQIKNEYIETNKQLNELYQKQNKLSKSVREILDNETNLDKRKDIIDFVFADNVEEIHEYSLRKMYL